MRNKWTSILNNNHIPNANWNNDSTHIMGLFQLNIGQNIILPYMGISSRIAPVVGCTGNLAEANMAWINKNCTGSMGGTPNPQTLVEWTYTPLGGKLGDVIDCSFVDGFSLPVRIEYKKLTPSPNEYTTILGKLDLNNCKNIGGKVARVSCQSLCSQYPNTPEYCCCQTDSKTGPCLPSHLACQDTSGKPKNSLVKKWCKGITSMIHNEANQRLGYCYGFDDKVGSIRDQDWHNPIVKVTFCSPT